MAPFDPKAYEQAVVKPLRGWSGRELPDDLLARYAVDLGMADHEVERRLREVRSRWNKGLSSPGHVQKVYRAFLKADEQLQETHGAKLTRIEWWREYATARQGANQQRIEDLAKTLAQNFGVLGLIAPGQLDATVRATYASLAPGEVDEALVKAGVTRGTPLELPKSSGLVDTTYRHLVDHLVDAGCASVVELLLGERKPFHLLDEKAAADVSGTAVAKAVDRENRRAGNQGARQALGILTTAAKDGSDLRKLALFHLLDEVRKQHGQGVPTSAVLKQLLATGWEPAEGRLAVFSVLNESATAPAGNLASVRELLEEGRLAAAEQLVASIAGADDAAAAVALVDRQRTRVRELVGAAREALRTGAESDAGHQLRQAVALAADDEELRAELRRVPPEPVLAVTVQEDRAGVRVSWRQATSHDDTIQYRVVRRPARTPADVDDGVAIDAEAGRTVLFDPQVPAATPVGYAVFAAVAGGAWSRPAGAVVEVVPGVGDVQLSFSDGAVEGRWSLHPEAVGVDVRRGDGVAIKTVTRTQFRDKTVPEGTEQVYTLVARYRHADGSETGSAPVRARTTTTGRPMPVRALSLRPAESGATQVVLGWKSQPDTEVVIRRAAHPCPWEFGALVDPVALAGYGEEVAGSRDERDGWQLLTADVPTGRFHYVAFTMGPDGAIRGHDDSLGIALPVSGVSGSRLGDEVLLAWEWPEQVGTADVRWRTANDSGSQLITRQQYRTGGGCRVRCGAGGVTVKVRTKVLTEGGECTSPDVEVVVPDRPPTVRYAVDMSRRPVFGGGTVKVRISADQEIARCQVVLVVAEGPVMPRRPGDGIELARGERALAADREVELTAQLPRLRKPYWVRCFVDTEGVRVVDPSINQLKVS
ncbi:hypothetical protein ACGFMK_13420 [Amycolatopsis sp. NPDC049252]|uniref:hypothetical protein n=1 Tax=Amycolatopsis sp. NPDC049252 TaxID=3363933 RepID=UPI00371AEB54